MDNLAEIFEKKLNDLGIKNQVDAAMICEAFDKAIKEVFGGRGTKNIKAISFKDGILKVGISSSSWANEVNLRRLKLLNGQKIRIIYQLGLTNKIDFL